MLAIKENVQIDGTRTGPVVIISPLIPLHSINNTHLGELMRFKGSINGHDLDVFIDCGAAMNFLNPMVATKLGLPIHKPPAHLFTTASGHNLSPSGQVHNITVDIQQYKYLCLVICP
ncbi:retropepsin-like aspartic protease [Acidovorax sp. BLS4]|uniref:retropepsin-like aspartic protease n=1 Tax=Acidovorax sp. BLS4 TaxID=3273430 RepID=UPI00355C913F